MTTTPTAPSLDLLNARCQRWRDRRDFYRDPESQIDATRYGVEALDEATAKAFVTSHHYSGSYPAARSRVGLYRSTPFRKAELVGVAVFSVPMHGRVIPKWTGQAKENGVELGRLVLLDDVEGNGETWFLSRAFQVLQDELPEVKAVVSFSDPLPRVDEDGELVKPGHYGTIYQAANARYVGRCHPSTLILAPNGEVVSKRSLSKLRNGERGAGHVYENLRALGAPRRLPGESDRAYAKRAVADFRRVRHHGNLAYTFALGSKSERRAARRAMPPALDYPKADPDYYENQAAA